jgi:ribose 5-phosphate isomerase A
MAANSDANEKVLAARKSLEFIQDGMLLGLGSGSTVAALVPLLGERIRAGLRLQAVCASSYTRALAEQAGIPLLDEKAFQRLDLAIDGADELDPALNAIKGGGGALLRERIVAAAADRFILVADSRKPVARLGQFPLPVEVTQFGWQSMAKKLAGLFPPTLRLDKATGQPFISDEGNYILDCKTGPIADPVALAARLSAMAGVMAHGLFIGMASLALIAHGDRVEVLQPRGS